MSAYPSLLYWLGEPVVAVASDGTATPYEGVSAETLAQALVFANEEMVRLRESAYRAFDCALGGLRMDTDTRTTAQPEGP